MKPSKYITALLVTISIILSIQAITDNHRTGVRIKSTESRLNDTQAKISALERESICPNNQTEITAILGQIETLVRENENLRQENKDLKTQLTAANSFWKGMER